MNKNMTLESNEETIDLGRRNIMARFGLMASVACAAPVLMTMSTSAQAGKGGRSGGRANGNAGTNAGGGNSGSNGGNAGGANAGGSSSNSSHSGGNAGGNTGASPGSNYLAETGPPEINPDPVGDGTSEEDPITYDELAGLF